MSRIIQGEEAREQPACFGKKKAAVWNTAAGAATSVVASSPLFSDFFLLLLKVSLFPAQLLMSLKRQHFKS